MSLIQFDPGWEIPSADLPRIPGTAKGLSDGGIPVVIAEDDPVSRKLVTAVIEAGGFRTIVTNDGDQAMSALREQNRPCVAVVDWMMPGTDGAEICRRMRDCGKAVYIIMLTARAGKEDTVEALEGGADDYVVKPFDRRELLARIRAGVRILTTQTVTDNRVRELEESLLELKPPKFQMPI